MFVGPFHDTWDDEPPSTTPRPLPDQTPSFPSLPPIPPEEELRTRATDALSMDQVDVRRGRGGSSLNTRMSRPPSIVLAKPYERSLHFEEASRPRRLLVNDVEPSGKKYKDRYGRETDILIKTLPLPQKDHGVPKPNAHRLRVLGVDTTERVHKKEVSFPSNPAEKEIDEKKVRQTERFLLDRSVYHNRNHDHVPEMDTTRRESLYDGLNPLPRSKPVLVPCARAETEGPAPVRKEHHGVEGRRVSGLIVKKREVVAPAPIRKETNVPSRSVPSLPYLSAPKRTSLAPDPGRSVAPTASASLHREEENVPSRLRDPTRGETTTEGGGREEASHVGVYVAGEQRPLTREEVERPMGGNEALPLASTTRGAEVDLPDENTYTPSFSLSSLSVEGSTTMREGETDLLGTQREMETEAEPSGYLLFASPVRTEETDLLSTQREMESEVEPSGYLLFASPVRTEETDLPLREESIPYAREPTPMAHDEREIFRATERDGDPTKRTLLDARGVLREGGSHVEASSTLMGGKRTLLAKGGLFRTEDMFRATRKAAAGGRAEERRMVDKPVRSAVTGRIVGMELPELQPRGGGLEGSARLLPLLEG